MTSISFTTASLLAALAPALNDLFVDQNAANCGLADGSSILPFCTIDEAIGASSSGDTLHIAPGTYVENLSIGRDLTFIGTEGFRDTIVDGNALESVFVVEMGMSATFEGLTIRNGMAQDGGGIRLETQSNLVVRDCLITENRTLSTNGHGGGGIGTGPTVFGPVNVTIENSTLSENESNSNFPLSPSDAGGAINHDTTGDLVIRDSALVNNSADLQGGAIFTSDTRIIISNTTISGNTARIGAGFFSYFPAAGSMFDHVTITNNTAGRDGAGYVYTLGTSIRLRHTLVAGNVATSPSYAGRCDLAGPFITGGFNLIGVKGTATPFTDGVNNDQVGSSSTPIDPGLGPLELNGGSTLSHRLLPGSPAIDTGDSMMFLPFDQRGVARPFNGVPDVGAIEFTDIFGSVCSGNGGVTVGCTACPCGNDAGLTELGGCLNRTLQSGLLSASGDTSVSLPAGSSSDLRFSCIGLPPAAFSVLLSGDAVAPQNPANPCFGQNSGTQSASYDGLRCAVQAVKRHGGRASDGNGAIGTSTSPWGGEGAPPAGIARALGGFAAGQLRYFQAIYREDPLAGCMRGLNSTQAIGVVFGP